MRSFIVLALVLAMFALTGCAKVVGPYYLEQGKYKEGIETLEEQLRENPEDVSSAYYVGRFYLGLNKPKKALPYLERAAALESDNANYQFWTGVAYWALLDFEREKEAYERALRLDPDHISANLYLGHGFVDRGDWSKALSQYDRVLKLDKYNPEALYNRAVSLEMMGRPVEGKAAWKKFLEFYPDGSLAMEATERLNLQGDFTYRNFIIGKRNVTLRNMAFKPGTNDLIAESRTSLHVLSAMMRANKKLKLHIVSFAKGDAGLAKARARAVRDYMISGNPDIDSARLPLSWFGTAEEITMREARFILNDSVKFITEVR